MKKCRSEHAEQSALFQWARLNEKRWPELALLFAIPNFSHGNIQWGVKMSKEGKKAGVPDLQLPVPRGTFHGLFIEMKSLTGRASSLQKLWLSALETQGYRAVICQGFEAAKKEIEEYLGP